VFLYVVLITKVYLFIYGVGLIVFKSISIFEFGMAYRVRFFRFHALSGQEFREKSDPIRHRIPYRVRNFPFCKTAKRNFAHNEKKKLLIHQTF